MVKQIKHIGRKKDAINRSKWHNAVYELSRNRRGIRPPLLMETKPDLKHWTSLSLFPASTPFNQISNVSILGKICPKPVVNLIKHIICNLDKSGKK